MHELSIADAVVTIAREHARGRRVTSVEVRIGHLRQVVPDALEFAFELVAAGTEVGDFPFACALCGSLDVEVVAGDELLVESLELEEEPLALTGR